MFTDNLRAMWHDDDGVSPVIGVILMVAVTVVLAAVIGAFVFGMGDSLNSPAPNAQIAFDYNADDNDVAIVHDGGDTIKPDNAGVLAVTGDAVDSATDGGNATGAEWGANLDDTGGADELEATVTGQIGAGDTIWDSNDGGADGLVESGESVELVWNAPDGGTSQVIGTFEAP